MRFRFRCELTEYLGSERLAFGTLEGWEGREIVWRFPSWERGPGGRLRAGRLAWRRRGCGIFDAASGLRRPAAPLA